MIDYLYIGLLYSVFALAPVFIWLFFYFKKDSHPEPKKMILKIFILGIVAAFFAALFEVVVLKYFRGGSLFYILFDSFLVVGLAEELAKYLVVRINIYNNPVFDEPLDIMLYMVVSALGFAALENLILFFAIGQSYFITFGQAFEFAFLRFIGAVFLHTLTSGTIGFFIAISFYSLKNKKIIFLSGFFTAVILHGIYDIAMTQLTGFLQYLIPAVIIVVLAFFTTYGFIKLKSLKSVCKIA